MTTPAELEALCLQARADFPAFAAHPNRPEFLRAVAAGLEAAVDDLVALATRETHLPEGRIRMETGRTAGQLRMFADLAASGQWREPMRVPADPTLTPPRPDMRRMLTALGPVAVFGASNFPLAFSVAGGDTASAWAVGCPVLAKAHPAHPETCRRVAQVIADAAQATGMPAGAFVLVEGGIEIGQALVQHPAVTAVGFTGSQAAGRALFDLAAARPTPIPVYAEMGSVNPLVILPDALHREGLAASLAGSITLGVGQFCTKPGLILTVEGDALPNFSERLKDALQAVAPAPLLHPGIAAHFATRAHEFSATGVTATVSPQVADNAASAGLWITTSDEFRAHPTLSEEIFGPAAVMVVCTSVEDLLATLATLPGQLTGSLHFDDAGPAAEAVLQSLAARCGRLVINGFPTGVAVNAATVHGGPYPATTAPGTTSVGTEAFRRWTRLVCYQDCPESLLPEPLKSL